MLKEKLFHLLQDAIFDLNLIKKDRGFLELMSKISVNRSKIKEQGAYFTNAAFILAGPMKKNPQMLAQELVSILNKNKESQNLFEKIEVAGNGFINFFISKNYLQNQVLEILKNAKNFCYLKIGNGKKVQIEFISANPTGELHLGHGRGAFFGDVLANILKRVGYKTFREYFINDAKKSLQIKELGNTAAGKGAAYLTAYLKSKIKNKKLKTQIKNLETKDIGEIGYLLAQEIQKDNQEFITKELKIDFDKWFSEEKELYKKFEISKTLALLKNKNLVYEKEGALWLKTEDFGDDEDRVLVRSTGEPSYFLSDIAYHKNKFSRSYKKIIDIWGADHQGHQKRMMAVKKILGFKGDLDILISQLVTLKSKGKIEKFSKRKGKIITLKWLVDKVGLDVAKFFYLMKSLDTHMEFDLDLALEQSEKNPVYYLEYAYVRAGHIIEKSKFKSPSGAEAPLGRSQKSKVGLENLKLLNNELELNLILKMLAFPEVLEEISKNYQVHDLAHYALDLAADFHRFYKFLPVLNAENKNLTDARLSLVLAFKIILENIFDVLGIKPPEKM